jgi:dTDP-4-dehydrorhamnose reductase
MLKIGKNKPFINVVSDQTGSPTCASDLADAIYKIVHEIFFNNNSARGIYHYSGEGITSWFGFAEIIFQIASRYGKIVLPKVSPISASQYPSKTKRPKYSVLDCTKIKEDFGITTKYWETSLENVIQKIMRAKTNGLQPNRLIT